MPASTSWISGSCHQLPHECSLNIKTLCATFLEFRVLIYFDFRWFFLLQLLAILVLASKCASPHSRVQLRPFSKSLSLTSLSTIQSWRTKNHGKQWKPTVLQDWAIICGATAAGHSSGSVSVDISSLWHLLSVTLLVDYLKATLHQKINFKKYKHVWLWNL